MWCNLTFVCRWRGAGPPVIAILVATHIVVVCVCVCACVRACVLRLAVPRPSTQHSLLGSSDRIIRGNYVLGGLHQFH